MNGRSGWPTVLPMSDPPPVNDPKTTLPPFAALRAFHAAATHDRYRDAAASLGLTESAISHQIRRLEAFLHLPLFDRSGRRPALTEAGRRYLAAIEPALHQIQAATAALRPAGGRRPVRLTLPPTFAATWLIPRLGDFERDHPDIDLQLTATTRVVDLRREQMDLAIRHGRGAWPDVTASHLLEETVMPVCAPGYLAPTDRPLAADALAGLRLIVNASVPNEWEEWARAHGLDPPAPGDQIALDALEQALQVAESGHGLAMGRRPGVDAWLKRGRLIAPFGRAAASGAAFYLCRPTGTTPTAAERRVARWLTDAAARWRTDNPTV